MSQTTVPWGRAASEFRPGLFAKQFLQDNGKASAADVFSALKEKLRAINKERVEIGDRPIKGGTYNSFAKYWAWFKVLGLIEPTDETAPAIYDFLERKRFFRLTEKGRG